ncbi:MAG TPA: hypothetical protein VJ993_06355, partial [Woeseiaceae bacterium]|nr:hypothetical protein [Woeseiaceae bacterium]
MNATSRNTHQYIICLITLAFLSACAGPGALVTDQLDPLTGVTVTRATKPLVLYRDRSAQSAFGRDYVYLGPLEINNMGERRYYFWFGVWSTSDSVDRGSTLDNFESVVIYADGEPLSLQLAGTTLGSIGVSEPVYVKPTASATDAFYAVTIDQIRLVAESRDLELRVG